MRRDEAQNFIQPIEVPALAARHMRNVPTPGLAPDIIQRILNPDLDDERLRVRRYQVRSVVGHQIPNTGYALAVLLKLTRAHYYVGVFRGVYGASLNASLRKNILEPH